MLTLDPSMILICTASYNRSNELIVHDEILEFSIENDPYVRYLNRIKKDSCCSDDGFIQCSRFGPDRLELNQLPPVAVSTLQRLIYRITLLVSLDDKSTIQGNSKRSIPSLDPTKKSKANQPCTRAGHRIVNVEVGKKLEGKMHLVPYANQSDNDWVKFARVTTSRMPPIIERLLEGPDMADFDVELAAVSAEDIKLQRISVGEGFSTCSDSSKPKGHVDNDGSPHPDRRRGPTSSTWVPVTNEDQEKHTPEELDSMFNIAKLTQVLEHTFGKQNAERDSVDHGGTCQYYDTSSVVSQQ